VSCGRPDAGWFWGTRLDDFFSDFLSGSPAAAGRPVETQPRRAGRIDVTRFFSHVEERLKSVIDEDAA
jgi:hypothetical protein